MSTIFSPVNLQVNTASLYGQMMLKRTDSALATSIRNLSSGVRIHTGRDDPVGFVSSTAMRTDITSMSQAVANCERADAVLSTAESALSHLSSLLIDLRGLVTQAANTGAETPETLLALQLEADAVLSAIDFISTSTSFQNQKLIDGSLDFTTYGIDESKISYLSINQANFLGRTEKDISVQVLEPARQAELYYPYGALKNSVVLSVGGTSGYQTFSFDKEATVQNIADTVNRLSDSTGVAATVYSQSTPGTLGLTSYGKNNDVILTASEPGTAAGNFVVRYTAPKEGNQNLSLNVSEGSGNEPTVVEVMLQTEAWQKAEYHYNGNQDGTSNNEFSITANQAGKEFNEVNFVFNNVFGTGQATGLNVDLSSSPKTFTVNVSYNEANPADPNNTTVNDLAAWIKASPVADTYFTLQNTVPSSGAGPLIPSSPVTQTKTGVSGGGVVTTAEQVATLINTSPLLKKTDGTGRLTATLPTDATGTGTVSPFAEVSYYGSVNESNYLQFLAPEGSPTIKFVSTPGTPLSVDDSTDPPVYGHATAQIQGFDAGTSFTLRSLVPGPDSDGVNVILRDAASESAIFDAEQNAVVISVDFTGRKNDPNRSDFTMNDLTNLISSDPLLSKQYTVTPLSTYSSANPPSFSNDAYLGINAKVGETTGGLISKGSIVVHLETDEKGIIKTTANDLVKFFNDPSTEESKVVLDRYGISVSSIDPNNSNVPICTTGRSANGSGLLSPTYDPSNCVIEDQFPDIIFSSFGNDIQEEHPTATIISKNGSNSDWVLTAKNTGAAYNNTSVRVISDSSGPAVRFDPTSKTLTVLNNPQHPSTTSEVVAMINADPSISELFVASVASHSTGEGIAASGDKATLTGGIVPVDRRPEGSVASSGGINATFNVHAKKSEAQYNETEILVVPDVNGSKVTYDSQSKQLTIGVNPNNLPTAREIVNLINETPEIRDLFEASIPALADGTTLAPTGEGSVQIGDSGTLRVHETSSALGAAMIGNSDNQSLGITFHSVEYGSKEFVSVMTGQSTDFPVKDRFGNVMEKTYGTDCAAKINGQLAVGDGRIATTVSSDLDVSIWLDPSVQTGDVFGFRITGGGALIQFGPDAISEQQARIALKNVNTVALGGESGYLSQIRTGGEYDLLTDTKMAFKIVDEVTSQVALLRGRIGAFQKTQIEANKENMTDAIEIETGARSEIADADFAEEASNMARLQLLMQSNITVLQQSMQSRQLLLSLLQG